MHIHAHPIRARINESKSGARHRNLPCTRRQRCWGDPGLCAEVSVEVAHLGGGGGGGAGVTRACALRFLWKLLPKEEGRVKGRELSPAVEPVLWLCFCPDGNTATFIVCVNAGVLECLFLWCFLLLMVQSLSHTGRHYVKRRNNAKMS